MNRSNDHLLIQLGINSWANMPDSIQTKGLSRTFNIYFMMDFPFKTNPHFSVAAGEIVSDVFIRIWNKRQSLPGIENLHLYLYISTKNQAINYLTRQNREKTFSPDEVVVELRSIYYDPEQLLITAEMLRLLQHAISQLPPRCQLIFKLVKEDGLKYKEVAELIGVSIKTVENQMTIALRKIDQSIQFDEQKSISSAK